MSGEYQKYRPFPKHGNDEAANKTARERADQYMKLGGSTTDENAGSSNSEQKRAPAMAHYHSSTGVKPNVVRIEVLSPAARRRYLNGGLAFGNRGTTSFQAEADMCKQFMTDAFTEGDCWKPFYGITDQSTDTISLSFTSDWQANKGATSGINSFVGKLAGATANVAGNGAQKAGGAISAFAGLAGNKALKFLGTSLGGLTTLGGKAIKAVTENIGELPKILEAMYDSVGADYKMSGACTLRQFVGSNFKPAKQITCKWYMPEQEKLARISIGRLIRMSYSRGLRTNMNTEDYRKMLDYMCGAAITNIVHPIADNIGIATNDKKVSFDDALSAVANAAEFGGDKLASLAEELGYAGGAVVPAVLGAFGNTMTIDPLPVRLTVGHILDVEPLVITGVSLVCSKEQYVSPDGSHLPLFVTAKIDFDMWMMPNPNTGFIQFMGDPLFRQDEEA